MFSDLGAQGPIKGSQKTFPAEVIEPEVFAWIGKTATKTVKKSGNEALLKGFGFACVCAKLSVTLAGVTQCVNYIIIRC